MANHPIVLTVPHLKLLPRCINTLREEEERPESSTPIAQKKSRHAKFDSRENDPKVFKYNGEFCHASTLSKLI